MGRGVSVIRARGAGRVDCDRVRPGRCVRMMQGLAQLRGCAGVEVGVAAIVRGDDMDSCGQALRLERCGSAAECSSSQRGCAVLETYGPGRRTGAGSYVARKCDRLSE